MGELNRLARQFDCLEMVDTTNFQQRARILQALWREERGYPIGAYRDRPSGSCLQMPWAEQELTNFLDETIRGVVRRDVCADDGSRGRLIQKERLFGNLLSSQPLAYNLFAHLQIDLTLASAVFGDLLEKRCKQVTAIRFEFSPGRGDPRYTGDRSAFDVYARFIAPEGGEGFVGIEVKYHENLQNRASRHHQRYNEVAEEMGCFRPEAYTKLRHKPLQQIWRDHLLAGAHRIVDRFDDGLFVFLSPSGNTACNRAIAKYQQCLLSDESFQHWTLESVIESIQRHAGSTEWVAAFIDRYLDFSKVDRALDTLD